MNFTLSLIFHIQARTLKLNRVNIENNVNIAQYESRVQEKANLVHKSIYHVSFPIGIKKLTSNKIAIVK